MTCRRRKFGKTNISRSGLAALEAVITTVFTMVIFGTLTFITMRLLRIIFSVAGEMTGTPLM